MDGYFVKTKEPWVVGGVEVHVEEGLHAVVVVVELLHQTNPLLLAGVPARRQGW